VVVGLIGALGGRTAISRMLGWQVAGGTAVLLAVAAGLAAGCGGGSGRPGTPTTPATAARPDAAPPAKAEVTQLEIGGKELAAAVAGYKDKVVVVDFWATWCGPCVKKFPHLVELHKKHAAKGLVCVSVDMGRLGVYDRAKSLEFLTKQQATFPNFAPADPDKDGAAIEKAFGEDFRLLPYLVVFDRGGRRVWDSAANLDATPAQVEAKVVELLAK
jgi:thiol-disulfide isomerase/thioredoxin